MVDLYTLKEMCMKENGWMTKHMVTEYILIIMEVNMKDSGSMINNTALESKDGQMVLNMKEHMNKE
jgi:hypothetical protein